MGLFSSLPKEKRLICRRIARESMIEAKGDASVAKRLARVKFSAWKDQQTSDMGVGSVLLFLTVAAVMLQLIYYGIKIWKETRCVEPPVNPGPDDPFIWD